MSTDDQVWKMEKTYWKYVKADNIQGYLTLWHKDFVGWPGFSPKPMGKSNISDWIPGLFADDTKSFDYNLHKMAVAAFENDMVVTHPTVEFIFIDKKMGGKTLSQVSRITHTWKRYGDKWLIISGMSAKVESSPDQK
jgi:ketosteroid isomerase-like protein